MDSKIGKKKGCGTRDGGMGKEELGKKSCDDSETILFKNHPFF
jgi:hypothetical protein